MGPSASNLVSDHAGLILHLLQERFHTDLTQKVFNDMSQKSTPPQIRKFFFILVTVRDSLMDVGDVDLCKTSSKTLCVR